jgi:NAD(P)H dehydrogenase (quinone)
MKKILIINGHPVEESYGSSLANAYFQGAKKGNFSVETITVRTMEFNPNLMYGYNKRMELEPDIENAINQMKEADHIVWIFPIWWHGTPALLKGFIDRTLLPGIAYDMKNRKLPKKLFKEKSSRIIVTCDTPRWYNTLFLKNPAINQLKKGTLNFIGIKPVRVTYISPIRNSSQEYREDWINKVNLMGMYGK